MNRKLVAWNLTGSLLAIIFSFGADEALFRFVLIGEVPGSEVSLSASTMLGIWLLALATLMTWLLYPVIRSLVVSTGYEKALLPKKRFTTL